MDLGSVLTFALVAAVLRFSVVKGPHAYERAVVFYLGWLVPY